MLLEYRDSVSVSLMWLERGDRTSKHVVNVEMRPVSMSCWDQLLRPKKTEAGLWRLVLVIRSSCVNNPDNYQEKNNKRHHLKFSFFLKKKDSRHIISHQEYFFFFFFFCHK